MFDDVGIGASILIEDGKIKQLVLIPVDDQPDLIIRFPFDRGKVDHVDGGAVKEILGSGSIFGVKFITGDGMLIFVLAPGAFIALGYLIVLANMLKEKTT